MARKTLLVLFLAMAIAGALSIRTRQLPAYPPGRLAAGTGPSAREVRDHDIQFYQTRVARDPYGARDRAALAALYLARGRANGDASDFARAESLATTSLRTRSKRNSAAIQVLVSALMAEHRFAEAWKVMLPEAAADSTDIASQATLGEIGLELGRYPEADSLFGRLSMVRTNPSIAPRYARWLELSGRSGDARELLAETRKRLENGFRVPPEQLAWFDLRIGDLAFRNGREDLAESAFDRGLSIAPDDSRLLAAKARLAASKQQWDSAIAIGERAIAGSFEPGTLGLLSEVYEAKGDSQSAAEYARAVEVSLSNQPGAYHRGWALFLLDHDRQVDRVLQKARLELGSRKDIYGYDVMAWALFKAGRLGEAKAMADKAVSRGTRDAVLWYHHAVILKALGDSAGATADLQHAYDINPHYRPWPR